MTRYEPPQVPLEYEKGAPSSGWRVLRQLAVGAGAGVLAAVLFVMLLGVMFPQASRADVGRVAGYILFSGLGMGATGIGLLVFRKWFWAGMVGSCGLLCAVYGFFIGLMSSITC